MFRKYSQYFGRMIWAKSEEDPNRSLQVGDSIKCHDAEDLIDTYNGLSKLGIITDCDYDKYKLIVTRIEGE